MKKYLTLSLLLLLFSCTKEKQEESSQLAGQNDVKTITLDQALRLVKSSSLQTIGMPMTIMSGETTTTTLTWPELNGCTITTNTDFAFRTHGKTSSLGPLGFWLNVKNDNGQVLGAGVAIRYPFKLGKSYTITVDYNTTTEELNGDQVHSVNRRPTYQMQVTNSATNATLTCADDLSGPVTLVGPDPLVSVTPPNTNNYQKHTSYFTVDKCYEFLRFSALPNMTGRSAGYVSIGPIKIVETSHIDLIGPDLTCANDEGDFSAMVLGFNISDSFTWSVTGNLQIIGSNVGTSVKLKSTGNFGGTLSISSPTCGLLATRTFGNKNITFKPYVLCDYSDSFTMEANYIPGVTNISWEGVSSDNTVFDLGSSGWSANIPPNTRTVRFKGTGECGPITVSHRLLLTNCLN